MQACDECIYKALIISIRVEIQWLHDGNLEEKKKDRNLNSFKHVWEGHRL